MVPTSSLAPRSAILVRRRGSARSAMLSILGLSLLAGRALAQESQLSLLSSLRPDTLIHLGVVSSNPKLDSCRVYFSRSPGPLRSFAVSGSFAGGGSVDLALQDNPSCLDYWSEKRWRYEGYLPSDLPPSGDLYLRAVLRSSVDPDLVSLSNLVTASFSSGPPELHYGFTYGGAGYADKTFYISRIDVDHGSVTPLSLPSVGYAGWNLGGFSHAPSRSSDGDHEALAVSVEYNGFVTSIAYVFDKTTETGIVLPQPSTPPGATWKLLWGAPKFQPGVVDRVWMLTRTWFACGSATYIAYELCAFDVNDGHLISCTPISGDLSNCQPGALGDYWCFDATGAFVCFGDRARSLLVCSMASGLPGPCASYQLTSGYFYGAQVGVRPIANSPRILATWSDAGGTGKWSIAHVDLSNGNIAATFTGTTYYGTQLCGIAGDGSYAVVEQVSASGGVAEDLLLLDTSGPVMSGAPMTVLCTVSYPFGGNSRGLAVAQGGDVVVAAPDTPCYPLLKITAGCDTSSSDAGTAAGFHFRIPPSGPYERFGPFCRLESRNALLVHNHWPTGNPQVDLLDVETMTHAALGFDLDATGGQIADGYGFVVLF